MGPFVPDIITDQLNLVVGFLVGIGFGFVIEQAGFSSSRKLTGLFYGTDFTVLRVFFTAGATAMIGVLLLVDLGLLDAGVIYINPTFVYSAIGGGLIMGVGFVVGGYCPGTSFCGAAVGRIDAMAFVGGGLVGVFGFGEAFPAVKSLYEAGSLGDITMPAALGISPGVFALVLVVVAIAAFVVTTRIELTVNPSSTAARFPVGRHRVAAAGLLALAVVLSVMPKYEARLLAKADDPAWRREHPVARMTPDEVAFRIVDHDQSLLLVDARSAKAFARTSLPGAVNIQPDALFGQQWRDLLSQPRTCKVFFADDEREAVRAATLALLLGDENVAVLQGGLGRFTDTILNVRLPAQPLTGGERDTYQFRLEAGPKIAALIQARGAAKAPAPKVKKIAGGCGV
jgi:rhodanese-related sulfurtransferase